MTTMTRTRGLHSQQGALAGEHPGRAANPVVKVHDLAWLEFEKPDLRRAELFARAFGFATSMRTPDELHAARAPTRARRACSSARARGRGFVGVAFRAADAHDVLRLATVTGRHGPQAAGEPGRDRRSN